MDRMFEELDNALNDLKNFLIQNDAVLDEGITFEIILTNKSKPYLESRKQENKALIINAIAYQENFDFQMSEATTNILNLFKEFAISLDKNKEKLRGTEINF